MLMICHFIFVYASCNVMSVYQTGFTRDNCIRVGCLTGRGECDDIYHSLPPVCVFIFPHCAYSQWEIPLLSVSAITTLKPHSIGGAAGGSHSV